MLGGDTQEQSEYDIFLARLGIGLMQGLALYILQYSFENKLWPANDPNLFPPLLSIALFVPLIAQLGIGNVRRVTLLPWLLIAGIIAAFFAWYDVWHAWPIDDGVGILRLRSSLVPLPHVAPSVVVLFFTGAFLFVIHALVTSGDADRRIIARYPVLFDIAWKQGVQVGIAVIFVGAFWIVLHLGVALFAMIHLDFFREFIQHKWFSIPATTLATAVAVHITDTRATLVRAVRTMAMMLLGWLLPVIVMIAAMFLVSLMFTGLDPLWQTRWATGLLIVATAVLIVLINAAYQDGSLEQRPHHVQRVAGTLGAALPVFMMALAAYALFLRIDQYGLTVDRISAAAAVLVMGFLTVGYLAAAVLPGTWLKLIETWNILTAFLALAVLFALFSPILDPMRLSVHDQMARLSRGLIAPGDFDVRYLRDHGGRFGFEALQELAKSPPVALAKRAQDTMAPLAVPLRMVQKRKTVSPLDRAKSIKIYPAGKVLPDLFLARDWPREEGGREKTICLDNYLSDDWHCAARIADFTGDGKDDVLLFGWKDPAGWQAISHVQARLFVWDGDKWGQSAQLGPEQMCPADILAILNGKAIKARPEHLLPELRTGRHTYRFVEAPEVPVCQ